MIKLDFLAGKCVYNLSIMQFEHFEQFEHMCDGSYYLKK